jgi:mannose-6-phosphate isomerase
MSGEKSPINSNPHLPPRMSKPYPILFKPLLKPRIWGGRSLERWGKVLPTVNDPFGECWELADLPASIPEGRSAIANGESAGRTLHELLHDADSRRWIMGEASLSPDGGFPLLIKYLDARQNLSVQVHPSIEYARAHPGAHVKSEAWVVIDAEPGAVIYKGLRPGVTREVFAEHIKSDQVADDLIAVPVAAGDCHYLPSGTCHALGAGSVVAEVQTPSDTTFRVYDWGRAGTGRQLHVQQALECIDFSGRHTLNSLPDSHVSNTRNGVTTTSLTQTEFFEIERVDALKGSSFPIETQGLPVVWMMLRGSAVIGGEGFQAVELRPGATALIPAAARSCCMRFHADSWLLCVRLPSPLRNMLA